MKNFVIFIIACTCIISCNSSNSNSELEKLFQSTLHDDFKYFLSDKKLNQNLYSDIYVKDLYAIDYSDWENTNYKSGQIVKPSIWNQEKKIKTKNSITITNKKKFDATVIIFSLKNQFGYGPYYLKSEETITINNLKNDKYQIYGNYGSSYKEKEFPSGIYCSKYGKFSKNKHSFNYIKDLIFRGGTALKIKIDSTTFDISEKPKIHSITLFEDPEGNALDENEIASFLRSNSIFFPKKQIINNNIVECVIITPKKTN